MKGINASNGVAIGNVFLYEKQELIVEDKKITEAQVQENLDRLNGAVEISKKELEALRVKTEQELSAEEAQVFVAHAMLLDDPEFIGKVRKNIEGPQEAASAVDQITKETASIFEMMDDEYFKERASDMRDVGNRLLRHVMGVEAADLSSIGENTIVVAEDLTPSDTAQMDKTKVVGFATDVGGRTSHTAIMARSLEIPAVLGLVDVTKHVKTGDIIVVDGSNGVVEINPDDATVADYQAKKEAYEKELAELAKLKDLPAETKDGHKVELGANIGTPNDVEGALNYGADGIGLYRTEFLYMDASSMPDEEVQYEAYKKVLEGMDGKPVIIRTLDIGGDKKLDYLKMDDEMNPFLGVRAIRLCFNEIELFKTQLKAILRASVYGDAHIMFPMISNINEVRKAKGIVEECKAELQAAGKEFDPDTKVGIMVEIPSAAVTADLIAKEVDFFSIGTNDLCQYTLAVDRMNEKIAHLYDPYNPAILRLVKNVIDASNQYDGKFTGMCGEMAGEPDAALLLLGLGLHEFSMSASSLLKVKKIIREASYAEAKEMAEKALNAENSDAVLALVNEFKNK